MRLRKVPRTEEIESRESAKDRRGQGTKSVKGQKGSRQKKVLKDRRGQGTRKC